MKRPSLKSVSVLICILSCSYEVKRNDIEWFYHVNKYDYDVLRMPLIYPYELVSAGGVDGFIADGGRELNKDFGLSGNIDSLFVSDSTIIMHGEFDMQQDCNYVILYKLRKAYFLNREDYVLLSKEIKINRKLMSTSSVYRYWCKNESFPWYTHKHKQ